MPLSDSRYIKFLEGLVISLLVERDKRKDKPCGLDDIKQVGDNGKFSGIIYAPYNVMELIEDQRKANKEYKGETLLPKRKFHSKVDRLFK